MTWSNLRFNVLRSFVTMATNLPFSFFIQFLEQLLKFPANFNLLKYVKSQRSYGFLITKKADFWLPNFGFKYSLLGLLNRLFLLYISTAKPFSLVREYIEVKINKHEIQ